MFEKLRNREFDVELRHHAAAILQIDMPAAAAEIETTLLELRIPIQEIIAGGGGEAPLTQRLRRQFNAHGWTKKNIEVKKLVDGRETMSLSHEIDHVKVFEDYTAALEIEWNNKDPFYDRDLEGFKRLHAEGAISIGVIVTRGQSLQRDMQGLVRRFADESEIEGFEDLARFDYVPTTRQKKAIEERVARTERSFREIWVPAFVSDKFGEATTHWRKLEDRMNRGVGNPCPLVLIGIPAQSVSFD